MPLHQALLMCIACGAHSFMGGNASVAQCDVSRLSVLSVCISKKISNWAVTGHGPENVHARDREDGTSTCEYSKALIHFPFSIDNNSTFVQNTLLRRVCLVTNAIISCYEAFVPCYKAFLPYFRGEAGCMRPIRRPCQLRITIGC